MVKVVLCTDAAAPDLAQYLDELEAALRDCRGQVDTEEVWVLRAVFVGLVVVGEDFKPRQQQFEYEAYKVYHDWQLALIMVCEERDQRIKVEVQVPADELCALMRALEALELGLDDLLHLELHLALGRLVELEVTVSILRLSGISAGMASERCDFVRVLLDLGLVALRPAFEVDLDRVGVLHVLLDDVGYAPVVDTILCIDEAIELERLRAGEQGVFLGQLKLVRSLLRNLI